MGNLNYVWLFLIVIVVVLAIPFFEGNDAIINAALLQKVYCKVGVDNIATGIAVCQNSNDTIHLIQGPGMLINITSNQINLTSVGGVDNGGTNVGAGAQVYKFNVVPNLVFRSFIGTGGIVATQNANDITFNLGIKVNNQTCSGTNRFSSFDNKTGNFVCSSTTSGLVSLNGDITAAQVLQGVSNNVTVTDAGATHTINLGSNVVTTQGSSQTITKGLTTNSLTLGGTLDANNHLISNLAVPVGINDAQKSNHLGLLGNLVTGLCANNQVLKYNSGNTTWICSTPNAGTITSINGDGSAAQTIAGTAGHIKVTDAGATHTIDTLFKINNATCGSGRFSSFDNKTGNFVCTGGTGGVNTLNGLQGTVTIGGQAGNTTVTTVGQAITIGLGVNPVITGGSPQTVTKNLTTNNLIFGGNANANNKRLTLLGSPTIGTDAARMNTIGNQALSPFGNPSDGQVLTFQGSNSTAIWKNDIPMTTLVNYPADYVVYKSGTTYYEKNATNSILLSNTVPETVLQDAFNQRGHVFVTNGTFNLSGGFAGFTLRSTQTSQTHITFSSGTAINVPNGYSGYLFATQGTVINGIFEGGFFGEQGSPQHLWTFLDLNKTAAFNTFQNMHVNATGTFVLFDHDTSKVSSGQFLNSNHFFNNIIITYKIGIDFNAPHLTNNIDENVFLNNFFDSQPVVGGFTNWTTNGTRNIVGNENQFIGNQFWDLTNGAWSGNVAKNATNTLFIGGRDQDSRITSGTFTFKDSGTNTQMFDADVGFQGTTVIATSKIGVGTKSPNYLIHTYGNQSESDITTEAQNAASVFICQRSGGTGAKTATPTGVTICKLTSRGFDGANYETVGASIGFSAAQTHAGNKYGTDIVFTTIPINSNSQTVQSRISDNGTFVIRDGNKLDIGGDSSSFAVGKNYLVYNNATGIDLYSGLTRMLRINGTLGTIEIGANSLTNSGHKSTLPTTSGILCQVNQTISCGTTTGTITGGTNVGKGTGSKGFYSGTSGTLIQIKNATAGTGIGVASNTTDVTISNTGVTSIAGTSNNVTVSASTGAVTLNLASNAVTTGLSAQTITKPLKLNQLNASSSIVDDNDNTKKLLFLLSGETTGKTLTIRVNQTTSQGLNIPDLNATNTIIVNGLAQTFLHKMTFTPTSGITSGLNIGTMASQPTVLSNGDIWIDSSSILDWRAGGSTIGAATTGTSQTISGAKTFTGANIVSTGSFDFRSTSNSLKLFSGAMTQRNPAGTFGYNFIGSAITANRTLTWPLTTQTETVAVQPTLNFTSPANQTGTTSSSGVMYGGFATFTPKVTGRVEVTVSGYFSSTLLGDGCRADVRYSTSSLGANGAALGGTVVGTNLKMTAGIGGEIIPFSKTVQITSMTVGTKYFIDMGFAAITGGTCTISNVDWAVKEL